MPDLTRYSMVLYVKTAIVHTGKSKDGWTRFGSVRMDDPEAGERMVRLQTTAVREFGVSTSSNTLKWEMSARYV